MKLKTLSLGLGVGLAALLSALAFAAAATARIPVEPGNGSPVTYHHPRHPAVKKAKKAARRNWGGYPVNGHTHVHSPWAPEDP